MHILIAPNSFKNSLAAGEVASAINEGLATSKLDCTRRLFPVGDGGDGTASLLTLHLGGTVISCSVDDPLGRSINASVGISGKGPTKMAILGLADASGLKLLAPDEYNPMRTTTFGTGQLMLAALEERVKKIILCIGGSATVDGGMGILSALGCTFFDGKGNRLSPEPESLSALEDIDTSGMEARMRGIEVIVLCDVSNPLLGNQGAAAIFGPQKGATPSMVSQLESNLQNIAHVAGRKLHQKVEEWKYGGAAGGVGAGLAAFLQAKLVDGIEYFLDHTGFDLALTEANLVITGEGSIDRQTLLGKAPYGVAKRARERSIPVIGMAGQVPAEPDPELNEFFDVLVPINHTIMDVATAVGQTHNNLVRTGKLIGDLLHFQDGF